MYGTSNSLIKKTNFYRFDENKVLGSELSNLTQKLQNIPNVNKIVVIADRDACVYPSNGKQKYERLKNNVYRFSIPVADGRNIEDKICIEHYYSDSEITLDIGGGKHLYQGKNFDEYGVSEDKNYFFDGYANNKSVTSISIIDSGSRHIRSISKKKTIASKNEFANFVKNNPDKFDFKNFKKIYEILEEIDKNG